MWTIPKIRRRAALTLVAGIAALIALPASAHRMHPTEIVAAAGHQRVLVRVMLKDLMLLSVNVEPTQTLASLRRGRSSFDELIAVVGRGNPELLAQSKTVPGDLLDRYDLVVSLWRELDRSILDALASRRVSAGQIGPLLDLGRRLGDSMDRLYYGYREAANHYGVTSVLGRAAEVGERTQAASQRSFAEFFALTHGGTDAGDPGKLLDTIEEVDRGLSALIEGDPEAGVLPAPTLEIRSHLLATRMLWESVLPSLRAVAAGDIVGAPAIASAARASADLLDRLVETSVMLAGLMPDSQRPAARRFNQSRADGRADIGS